MASRNEANLRTDVAAVTYLDRGIGVRIKDGSRAEPSALADGQLTASVDPTATAYTSIIGDVDAGELQQLSSQCEPSRRGKGQQDKVDQVAQHNRAEWV